MWGGGAWWLGGEVFLLDGIAREYSLRPLHLSEDLREIKKLTMKISGRRLFRVR